MTLHYNLTTRLSTTVHYKAEQGRAALYARTLLWCVSMLLLRTAQRKPP
jgi:hypothetical protein